MLVDNSAITVSKPRSDTREVEDVVTLCRIVILRVVCSACPLHFCVFSVIAVQSCHQHLTTVDSLHQILVLPKFVPKPGCNALHRAPLECVNILLVFFDKMASHEPKPRKSRHGLNFLHCSVELETRECCLVPFFATKSKGEVKVHQT